jgi:protein-S-isoprenylcysteine O-methyltransferase Ste14
MIQAELLRALGYVWAAFGAYWIGVRLLRKPPAEQSPSSAASHESRFYRPLRLLVLALTFSLLFRGDTAVGFLGKQFVPPSSALALCGFVAALSGMAIAVWARVHLGRFWSDQVVLQSGHKLVSSGPYRRMRHPIYSGVLLGVLGTAAVQDEWRGALAFLILLANYWIKARREENLLAGRFSDQYEQQRRHTGFLVPRFRLSSSDDQGPPVQGS